MNSYLSYKESGTEWVGDFPTNWYMKKLKYLFKEKKSTKNPSLSSGSISFGEVIYKDDEKIPISTKESYQELLKGEFLVNPLNLNYDLRSLRIGKSDIDVVVSQGYIILNLFEGNNPDYFKYLLREFDIRHMKSLGQGIRQTISFTHLKDEILVFPPHTEQKQIVSFLDTKTQKIDDLIEKTEQKIKLLKEKRTSLINHCVTKGLNPNVEMKDSGVEWIGEIPSHWDKIKVKYLGSIKSGDGLESSLIEPEGEFPVYGGNGVMGYYSNFNSDIPILVIGRVGEKCGNVHYEYSKVWINDNSLIFHPNEKVISIKYLFHSFTQRDFNLLRNQNTQPLITGTLVKNEYIPFPSESEQYQIVEYLDEQTQKIDSTIEKETQRIELLKEYRQSLISEVVTGKVDVRDWKE